MRAKTVRKKLAVLWVLGLVIIAGLGFTVWYAYHSSQAADTALKSANKVSSDVPKTPVVNSYDTCAKAPGSKILTSYPAQCVTTGGKTFAATPKYLVIKEWGVKIAADDPALIDAVYTSPKPLSSTAPGVESVELATKNTLKMDFTCGGQEGDGGEPVTHTQASNGYQLLRSRTKDILAINSNHPASDFIQIGGYYYVYALNAAPSDCVVTDKNLGKEAREAALAYAKSAILPQ